MRTVSAVTLALALGAPITAFAATNAGADVNTMVATYQGIKSVRVVERFENGSVATVDVMPAGQYRIAESGGQDPALVLELATKPGGGVQNGNYSVNQAGHKTIEGVPADGYQIAAPDGSYKSTVWVSSKQRLPISAHVQTQGHSVDVTYGDYNDPALIATR